MKRKDCSGHHQRKHGRPRVIKITAAKIHRAFHALGMQDCAQWVRGVTFIQRMPGHD